MSNLRDKIKNKKIDNSEMCLPNNNDENISDKIEIINGIDIFLPRIEGEDNFKTIALYYQTDSLNIKTDVNGKPLLRPLSDIEDRIDKNKDDIRSKSERIALDLYFIYHHRDIYNISNFKNYLTDRFKGEISRGYAYDIIKVTGLLIETKRSLELIKSIGMYKLSKTAQIEDKELREKLLYELEKGNDYSAEEISQINKIKNKLKEKIKYTNDDIYIKDLMEDLLKNIEENVSDNLTHFKPKLELIIADKEIILQFDDNNTVNDNIELLTKSLRKYFEINSAFLNDN